jgi:hypothetical protein
MFESAVKTVFESTVKTVFEPTFETVFEFELERIYEAIFLATLERLKTAAPGIKQGLDLLHGDDPALHHQLKW